MQKNPAKLKCVLLAIWMIGFIPLPLAVAAAALGSGTAARGQAFPSEYETFMSEGKPVSCAVYEAHDASATIIFLHGSAASEIAFGRSQARFFADHGFRVLLPEYLTTTPATVPTAANYQRWSQVVQDIVADLRSRPLPHNKKILLAGQALGASVALLAASHLQDVPAVAVWSGLLPNQFFSQVESMPPLLILHGEQDKQVPIVNARQLIRLCELRDFACEEGLYPDEGHILSSRATDVANQRALAFFQAHLR